MFQLRPRKQATEIALHEERDTSMSAEQESAFIKANRKTGRHYRVNWANVMIACKLAEKSMMYRSANTKSSDRGNLRRYPKLMSVESSDTTDRLIVLMAHGQHPEDYGKAADRLAHAWGAISCKVFSDNAGHVRLDLMWRDILAQTIPAMPIPEHPDFRALPIGLTETGAVWTVSLEMSMLLAGASQAGKASMQWGICRALQNAVLDGTAQVWAFDVKLQEFSAGKEFFSRYASDPADIANQLEDLVELLQKRQAEFAASRLRNPEPSKDYPLILAHIDEAGHIVNWLGDTKLQNRIKAAIQTLITQGRAANVVCCIALQDPRKEILPFRSLIPFRTALRLDDPLQPDLVLGEGMRERGGRADEIPKSMPGTAYVREDGASEPMRVRAGFPNDSDIQDLVSAVMDNRTS
jgi:S-DNA-T family DNA segregation ATPase FtsK/SpoIIIE